MLSVRKRLSSVGTNTWIVLGMFASAVGVACYDAYALLLLIDPY